MYKGLRKGVTWDHMVKSEWNLSNPYTRIFEREKGHQRGTQMILTLGKGNEIKAQVAECIGISQTGRPFVFQFLHIDQIFYEWVASLGRLINWLCAFASLVSEKFRWQLVLQIFKPNTSCTSAQLFTHWVNIATTVIPYCEHWPQISTKLRSDGVERDEGS